MPSSTTGKNKDSLRCYVSGEPVGEIFYLVSMSSEADRVFIVCQDHIDRVKDAEVKILVKRKDNEKD